MCDKTYENHAWMHKLNIKYLWICTWIALQQIIYHLIYLSIALLQHSIYPYTCHLETLIFPPKSPNVALKILRKINGWTWNHDGLCGQLQIDRESFAPIANHRGQNGLWENSCGWPHVFKTNGLHIAVSRCNKCESNLIRLL